MPDKIYYDSPFGGETFYKCNLHNIPYPKGDRCPKCAAMKTNEQFTFFWGGVFSQWWKKDFTVDGKTFNCAEQYMMYKKATLFKDWATAEKIMATNNPRKQKSLGRQVANYVDGAWVCAGGTYVLTGNTRKYMQNEGLKQELLKTVGTTLVEASPYDKIWGIGLAADDPRALQRETWLGENRLGEILTRLRDNIIESEKK